jgi:hypothetical protein
MERDEYLTIINLLQESQGVQKLSKHGLCRDWAREAILILHKHFPNADIEAREVDITPDFQHTFLRVILPNHKPFLLDGTGVGKKDPYFGSEEKAPEHLKNSHPDMINNYL